MKEYTKKTGGGQSNLHLGEVAAYSGPHPTTSISEDCFCQRFVLGTASLPWVQAIQSL